MDDIDALVQAILKSPRVRGKLVVLCEGDLLPVSRENPPSPQMYEKLEHMPDANFYKACVPRNWQNFRLPAFYNCGGRSQVLQVYRALLEEHRKNPTISYLIPDKLFALVDLDIQHAVLPDGYPWKTTEEIHADLYDGADVRALVDDRHRIWVTALVHKEAFFVLPCTFSVLTSGVSPFWDRMPLDMRSVHTMLAQQLANDGDVATHFNIVKMRLNRFFAGSLLDCTDATCLATSWLDAAKAANIDEYESLVRSLLAVAKAKEVWKEIVPDPSQGHTMSPVHFRDQLALKVGAAISMLEPSAHPLAGFFAWLEPRR